MEHWSTAEFWEVLLSLREGSTAALLSVFTLGVLVMGLLSNLTYGLLTDAGGLGWDVALRVVLVCGLILLLAYGVYRQGRRKLNHVQVIVDESHLAEPHRGLIWLLGPGGVEHALQAIRYHASGPPGRRLEHCWLVMQRGNQAVQEAQAALLAQVQKEKLEVRLEPVLVERLDVEAAYSAVGRVFEHLAPAQGLGEREVIADITGATKPMTTGMVLAALGRARDLEYVESQRDDTGAPVPGTQRVVWVNKTFRLERARNLGA
jgi:hypothetical protein